MPGPAAADGPHGIDDLRAGAHAAGPAGPSEPADFESRLDRRGVQFLPRPDVPEPPEVSALSWMVTDLADGKVLAAKDAHRPLPPASTLKTLFALTVLPKFSQGAVHTVSLEDLAGIESGSSLAGLKEDMPYQVADLWHGVFLSSGSDAVHTLASMNGGWRKTIDDMQETARRLGARDTRVESADGFDTPGQVSSAYDLSLFGQAGLTDRDFAHFASTKRAELPQDGGPDAFTLQNTNRLLVGSRGVRPYDGLIGVKNGYTTHAGNTLIAAARRDGRTLLVTLMNPQSGGRNAVYEETRDLLDWGFEAAPRAAAVGVLPTMEPVERTGEPQPVAHRSRPVPLHKAGVAAQPDGARPTRNWWFLSAAGAVGIIAVAGLGTVLWRRRRTVRASPSGESESA
ncbi:D-alanyl-D-alanine carboxypeptidase family protein [Streptomyces sp. Isolate_219]|uniref:D-alanyl-D-alanine carboxypeptidase family protein n=1 Tax=Streptomyces sp. Isolate_219 TaxID=2950110 RepID=UPI0021C95890|nr:serine hydrolase [Streptomyces sp. Isolate_219]MCR8577500.1 D-alanyl-D-alanine carboxypeptidase [Streptomyces sp. Isolate_219]